MKRLIIILTLFTTLLNCCYAANIKTVTKDYKIVSFIMRYDGMLCDEEEYESVEQI